MESLFKLQFIGLLFIIHMVLSTTTTINTSSLIITFAKESVAGSLGNSSLQPLNAHNITQMMQRGNIAMGFDQNKISHEFTSTKEVSPIHRPIIPLIASLCHLFQ